MALSERRGRGGGSGEHERRHSTGGLGTVPMPQRVAAQTGLMGLVKNIPFVNRFLVSFGAAVAVKYGPIFQY